MPKPSTSAQIERLERKLADLRQQLKPTYDGYRVTSTWDSDARLAKIQFWKFTGAYLHMEVPKHDYIVVVTPTKDHRTLYKGDDVDSSDSNFYRTQAQALKTAIASKKKTLDRLVHEADGIRANIAMLEAALHGGGAQWQDIADKHPK